MTQRNIFNSRSSTYHDKMFTDNIEATKFYIRHREGYPETELQDYARRGFWTLGIETATFEWVDDIDNINDLSPTVGVAGYIGDVHRGLKKLNKPIPSNIDYPDQLKEFLGRYMRQGTLGEVRHSFNKVFIKPDVDHKLFTGFVWSGDEDSRRKIVTLPDEVPIWISDPVIFLSEYRTFILDNKILDCRKYKGDWGISPDRKIIESAVEKMYEHSSRAFCLDFGVTDTGETLLVEMNEGFSMGHYGMHPVNYARMLSARWFELTSGIK